MNLLEHTKTFLYAPTKVQIYPERTNFEHGTGTHRSECGAFYILIRNCIGRVSKCQPRACKSVNIIYDNFHVVNIRKSDFKQWGERSEGSGCGQQRQDGARLKECECAEERARDEP